MKFRVYTTLALCGPLMAVTQCPHYVCCSGKNHFSPRDQGSQEFLSLAATTTRRHIYDEDEWHADLSILLGYERTWRDCRLSSYFLNPDGTLTVGPNNSGYDVRASDLGLGADCTGTAYLKPHFDNTIIDVDIYGSLDPFVPGVWLQLRIPFVYARAWPDVHATVTHPSQHTFYTLDQDIGIAKAGQTYGIVNDVQDTTRIRYTGACALQEALAGDLPFGDVPVLRGGYIKNEKQSYAGLAGVRFLFGYDFFRRERGNTGIALEVVAPAGNRPDSPEEFDYMPLVSASVGAQRQWKIGGVARGQCTLVHTSHESTFNVYLDARADYCLQSRVTRLASPPGGTRFSQCMLMQEFEASGNFARYVDMDRMGNLLRADMRLQGNHEAQATAMLEYRYGDFQAALGYNFFDRGPENLSLCHLSTEDFQTYLCVPTGPAPVLADPHDPDPALWRGGGFYKLNETTMGSTGALVPLSQLPPLEQDAPRVATATAESATTHDIDDLSVCAAAHPTYQSNTVFASVAFAWTKTEWQPYVSFIGKMEFGKHNCALSTWGLYFKTGAAF